MAGGYVYRKALLERLVRALGEGPVVLWGPPGFGKTLLLRELARERDLPYHEEEGEAPGVYDLPRPPARWRPGQVVALRRRPVGAEGLTLLGPEVLALGVEEAREMARHLGVGRGWRKTWERLGGWPLLVRRAYESGAARPHEEPLRSWLETFLARLTPEQRETLELLRLGPSEAAARRALDAEALATLLDRGLVLPRGGRLRPLAALASYLDETAPLPPFAVAERLLRAEAEHGELEVALQGYLRYGVPQASEVFVRAAARWNREGQADKTVHYWERLQAIEARPEVCLYVAEAEYLGGHLQRSLGLYEHAVTVREDREKRAEALMGLGTVRVRMGRYEEAVEAFREAARIATPEQRRRAEASLGGALIRIGRYREAAEVLERVRAGAAGEDAALQARAQHNLGIAYHHMGRIPEAVRAYGASLQLRGEDAPLARANTLLSLGEALRLAGRWEDAERTLAEARRVAEASGEYRSLGYSYVNTGDLYVDAGWLEEAEAAYLRAHELLAPSEDRYGTGLVEFGLGRMYARAERPREAEWRYRRALEHLREAGSPAELATVWIHQAELRAGPEALELLDRAGAAAEEVGARRVALRAKLERMVRLAPGFTAEQVEAAAAELVELEALPLLLAGRFAPVWTAAGAAGEAGALVFERLTRGWGTVRVHSLGAVRFLRERPVEFFTRKEPWVLFALWLHGPATPETLGERLFPGLKDPRKRVQIAVHHVREALGEAWIRFGEGVYRAQPLPGTWWDAAVLRQVRAARAQLPEWAAGAADEALRTLGGGPLLPGAPFDEARAELARVQSKASAI